EAAAAAQEFFAKWQHDPHILDQWFAAHARSAAAATPELMTALARHHAFDLRRTNRVKALVFTFAMENAARFHAADGTGYRYLADRVREVDRVNPPVAFRLLSPLTSWRAYD